jgi:carbamoyltransferase
MTTILGFTAWFHDSSACLLRDGQVIAFAEEEERFTRRKHTPDKFLLTIFSIIARRRKE